MVDEGVGSGNILDGVGIEPENFVEVMFAKSVAEAKDCCGFLAQQHIAARIEVDPDVSRRCGIAVSVPADRLVEASELLAARSQEDEDEEDDDYDDDYDDEDEDEYEDDDEEDDEEEYDDDDDEYEDDVDGDDDGL